MERIHSLLLNVLFHNTDAAGSTKAAIDEAIARNLPRVEAGAQGQHKLQVKKENLRLPKAACIKERFPN
eukprot:scaffold28190_cov18-Tisochrysis_lutea.AAC.3